MWFCMNKKELEGLILVGDGEEVVDFYAALPTCDGVLGIFCDPQRLIPAGLTRLGDAEDASSYLAAHREVACVCCSASGVRKETMEAVMLECRTRAVPFHALLPVVGGIKTDWTIVRQDGSLLLAPRKEPLSHLYNRALKRCVDLLFTVVFLLTFFPFVYLYKAFVLKRKKSGPSFSFARCVGPDGRAFTQVSFRDEENSLARLLNVLTGQMSLVGPASRAEGDGQKCLERKHVKAGLTGWAQVNGCEQADRMAFDLWYVEHWSLWLDLRIMFKSMF